MTRIAHWETRLAGAIEAARDMPFAWGRHDCATWAFEVVRDLTGGADHAALWRGRYSTALGSHRILRRLGWTSLEDGGRALLGDPLATPLLAQRGDMVLGSEDPAFGICVGARAAFVGPAGLIYLPLTSCHLAWRV